MKKTLLIIVLFGIYLGISANPISLPQKDGHVFSDLIDEYKLVSYFLNTNQKKYYTKLDIENKWKYLSTFWKIQDIDPTTECNEFKHKIIVRIKYTNKHFSHFKDGWETDMGKVYIKYGEPFEILELTNYGEPYEIFESQNSGHYVKLTERQYHIWKYRDSIYQTFLFIEPQQHGDLRLIYSDGEEQYGSWREWKDYLGTDFDASLLH